MLYLPANLIPRVNNVTVKLYQTFDMGKKGSIAASDRALLLYFVINFIISVLYSTFSQ